MSDIETKNEEIVAHDSLAVSEGVQRNGLRARLQDVRLIAGIVTLLLVGGIITFLIMDRAELKNEVNQLSAQTKEQASQADEARQLSQEVGKLIELPNNETPTIATVVDAEKVNNQAFFKDAQNGDKVLLYASSSKAILYRPSTQKIIEVAPINLGQDNPGTE